MKWIASNSIEILSFLEQNTTFSIKNIKQFLKFENVFVNQKVITNVHFVLHKNDIVEIIQKKTTSELSILLEDKDIIIVDKPANLLTISTTKEKEKTLYHMVSMYIKKNHKQGKVFIIHRLDKETSGIVIFAKNEKTKQKLQENWDKVKRYYMTVVHGEVKKKQDILKTYLEENKNMKVYASPKGKLAITEYIVEKTNSQYSLLNIQIHTGRKNQIRFQLNEIHHPIVGDKKYGIKDNEKRLYLHAYKIEFIHPITQKFVSVPAPIPNEFHKFIERAK